MIFVEVESEGGSSYLYWLTFHRPVSEERERESGGVGVWSEIYCSVITINVI